MKKVAITGNIGSGKSWVCALFEKLGIPVFYSDPEAKRLYYRDDVREAMEKRFGKEIYLSDNEINKQLLSSLIFNDKKAMRDVERILYPALNAWLDEWAEQQNSPYVLYESAIILEKHLACRFDALIMVSASTKTRLRRVMLRDNCSEASVRERMKKQWSDKRKCALADFVIHHDLDDDNEALMQQVMQIHDALTRASDSNL